MTNYLKFDLSSVTGNAKEIAGNISAFLSGDSTLAKSLVTHYAGKKAAEMEVIAKENPDYAVVKNGVEGYWLSTVSGDLRKAGHSEWVREAVIVALCGDE